MRCFLLRLTLSVAAFGLAFTSRAAQPPAGFTALFNGKDLTGWRGGDTFDHRVLLAMSDADRAAKIAEWTKSLTEPGKDGKPHWRGGSGPRLHERARDDTATRKKSPGLATPLPLQK